MLDDELPKNDPGRLLRKELDAIAADRGVIAALHELYYTAEQRGVIDEGFPIEDTIRLVKLAEMYARSGVPRRLRM